MKKIFIEKLVYINMNYLVEYRQYELPADFPIVALTGDNWYLSDDEISRMHFHNCLEIGLCISGEGFLAVENKRFDFSQGDISIVFANSVHISKAHKGKGGNWKYIYTDYYPLIKDLITDNVFLPESFFDDPEFVNIILKKKNKELTYLFNTISYEITEMKEGWETSVKGLMLSFMIILNRMIPNSNLSETKIRSKELFSLAPAIEYCEKNYMNNITVDCLAEKCHLSTSYFGKIFKRTLRLSPLEYIHHIRIYKACVLLSSGNDSILDISVKIGFSSLSSFNRQFKAIRGLSPSEWRKKAVSERNDKVSHTIFSMDEIENYRK